MNPRRALRGWRAWGLVALVSFMQACAGGPRPTAAPAREEAPRFGWVGAPAARTLSGGALAVAWIERLVPEMSGGPYVPIEAAVPALDPARDRIYVGTTAQNLVAMSSAGATAYRYEAKSEIEGPPAIDGDRDELYVGTVGGELHALRAMDGKLRWRESVGEPIRVAPALSDDAVYVVTDTDRVVALARANGESLWQYERERPEGFTLTTRAGITIVEGVLYTAFTDGTVVALDARDGRLLWERDTSLDLEPAQGAAPRFTDVDTTPVVVGERVYVASYAGGIYALNRVNGSVLWREPQLTGVIGLGVRGRRLVASSADLGVICLDLGSRRELWRKPILRGSPTAPVMTSAYVLVGETNGGFLALSLASGQERARIEAGSGFSAPAAVKAGRGFALSNGGQLYAFRIP